MYLDESILTRSRSAVVYGKWLVRDITTPIYDCVTSDSKTSQLLYFNKILS